MCPCESIYWVNLIFRFTYTIICQSPHPRHVSFKLYDLVNKIANYGLPELANDARRKDNLKHASLIPRPVGSRIMTNIQQNYVTTSGNLADQLGKFGNPHPDADDDPTSMTFMFDLSNFPTRVEDGKTVSIYHPPRFVIPAFKAAIRTQPMSVAVFSARFLHSSCGIYEYSVPANSPLRPPPSFLPATCIQSPDSPKYAHVRNTIPVYTDIKMKYPLFYQFNSEIFTPKASVASSTTSKATETGWSTSSWFSKRPCGYASTSPITHRLRCCLDWDQEF